MSWLLLGLRVASLGFLEMAARETTTGEQLSYGLLTTASVGFLAFACRGGGLGGRRQIWPG